MLKNADLSEKNESSYNAKTSFLSCIVYKLNKEIIHFGDIENWKDGKMLLNIYLVTKIMRKLSHYV